MDVVFDVRMPNLDLEGGMTVLCGGGEEAGVLLIVKMKVQPAGVNPDLAWLPAQEAPERQACRLGVQVPDCLLDGLIQTEARGAPCTAAMLLTPVRERGRKLTP